MRIEHRIQKQRVIIQDKAVQWINDVEWKALMKRTSGRHYPDLGQQGPSWSIPLSSFNSIQEWVQQQESMNEPADCVLLSHEKEPASHDAETQTADEPQTGLHYKDTPIYVDKQTQTDHELHKEIPPRIKHATPHTYKHNVPKDMLKQFSIDWLKII